MHRAKIPPNCWDTVVPAVAKVWDVLPLKENGFTKSPYELREGHQPDIRHLVPLGASAYARIYKEEPSGGVRRPTLRPQAFKGIVIGYPENEKGTYSLLLPDGRVKSRYDVVVDHNPDSLGQKPHTTETKRVEVVDIGERSKRESESDHSEVKTPTAVPPREPSSRRKPGPSPRHSTDQIVEPGTGSRGRVLLTSKANAAKDEPTQPPRRPGRMPLPEIIPDAPKDLKRATSSSQPPIIRQIWTESADIERAGFGDMIEPCNFSDTKGHKVYNIFDKLRYKVDRASNELQAKTRLVFDGRSQIKGIDYEESFSPTLSTKSLLIIIHLAAIKGMTSWQADIGNAYLQAIDNNELFVILPKYWQRSDGGRVYARLKGNTYGKVQAGRLWYFTIDELLIERGWKRSICDICVYYKRSAGKTIILGLVVDDTLIFCNERSEIDQFLKDLRTRFPKVTDCEPKVFAGMELGKKGEWTTVSQIEYIRKLLRKHEVKVDRRVLVPITTDMDARIREQIRSTEKQLQRNHFVEAGELRWLEKTRYDMQYALSVISQHQTNSTSTDREAIQRALQYLANTASYKIHLGGRDKVMRPFLIADGSKRNDSSMLAWQMYLSRDSGAVLSKCKKSKHASISSTDPEIRAIFEATKDALWTREFLKELGFRQSDPTVIYTDSDPAIQIFKSIAHDNATRYMIPLIAFIRQEIARLTIRVAKIKGTHNPADMGTKPLTRGPHSVYAKYALKGLGMRIYNGHNDFVKVA